MVGFSLCLLPDHDLRSLRLLFHSATSSVCCAQIIRLWQGAAILINFGTNMEITFPRPKKGPHLRNLSRVIQSLYSFKSPFGHFPFSASYDVYEIVYIMDEEESFILLQIHALFGQHPQYCWLCLHRCDGPGLAGISVAFQTRVGNESL